MVCFSDRILLIYSDLCEFTGFCAPKVITFYNCDIHILVGHFSMFIEQDLIKQPKNLKNEKNLYHLNRKSFLLVF